MLFSRVMFWWREISDDEFDFGLNVFSKSVTFVRVELHISGKISHKHTIPPAENREKKQTVSHC